MVCAPPSCRIMKRRAPGIRLLRLRELSGQVVDHIWPWKLNPRRGAILHADEFVDASALPRGLCRASGAQSLCRLQHKSCCTLARSTPPVAQVKLTREAHRRRSSRTGGGLRMRPLSYQARSSVRQTCSARRAWQSPDSPGRLHLLSTHRRRRALTAPRQWFDSKLAHCGPHLNTILCLGKHCLERQWQNRVLGEASACGRGDLRAATLGKLSCLGGSTAGSTVGI